MIDKILEFALPNATIGRKVLKRTACGRFFWREKNQFQRGGEWVEFRPSWHCAKWSEARCLARNGSPRIPNAVTTRAASWNGDCGLFGISSGEGQSRFSFVFQHALNGVREVLQHFFPSQALAICLWHFGAGSHEIFLPALDYCRELHDEKITFPALKRNLSL